MRISRRIRGVDRELTFRKLKEELNRALSDFDRDISDILDIIKDLKIGFESSIAEIFNPYTSSVTKIYEIKDVFERFENGLLLDIQNSFSTLPLSMKTTLAIIERMRFFEEDYRACLYDFFKSYLKTYFLSKVYKDLADFIMFGKGIIRDIAKAVESVGRKEGILKDKFKEIVSEIDEFVRRSQDIINKIIEVKTESERRLFKKIEDYYEKDDPAKLLRRIYEEVKNIEMPR